MPSTRVSSYRYALTFGDDPVEYLPDDYSQAQGWMMLTIKDFGRDGLLPGWRTLALIVQAENMPRAGFSFTAPGVGIIKCERVRA